MGPCLLLTQSGHRQFRICAATPDSGASEVHRRVSRKGYNFRPLCAGVICSRSRLRAERKRLYLVPVRLAEILATEAA